MADWKALYWAKVDKSAAGCWRWTGYRNRYGYGRLTIAGRTRPATHVALEMDGRPRSDRQWALHTCDNPACVNPAHLYWGSQLDNMRDRAARLRHPMAKLTPEIVREARSGALSDRALAQKHGVLRERIRDARLGRTWGHVA